MKSLVGLAFIVLTGCASLPHTCVPLCDGHYEVVCRAPTKAAEKGEGRDYGWERLNVCPWPPETRTGSCYIFAGATDGRQVYSFRAFGAEVIGR